MKYAQLLFICLLGSTLSISAQSNREYLITVDPATGVFTRIKVIPGVHYVQVGPSCTTIDGVNGRFFFTGDDSAGVFHLYTLDEATGNVLHAPVFPQQPGDLDLVGHLQFDDSTQTLYGTAWHHLEGKGYFISISEVTGVVTYFDSIPGLTNREPNSCTYDQKHHIYYFDDNNRLYSIDALTGHVIHAPTMVANSFISMRFDDWSGVLYGNSYGILLRIDPATADTTVLGGLAGLIGVDFQPSYTSMDNVRQRYTLASYTTSVQRLITLDTLGNTIYNIPFPVGIIQGDENITELNYDHHSGILYGLHWRDETATGINDITSGNISCYPDPFSQSVTFSLPQTYSAVTLSVYNLSGQLVRTELRTDACEITMDRGNLAAGVYTFEINSIQGKIGAGKVSVK